MFQFDPEWSKSITVRNEKFIEGINNQLGFKESNKERNQFDDVRLLDEPGISYKPLFNAKK